jgi:hypothetical protein
MAKRTLKVEIFLESFVSSRFETGALLLRWSRLTHREADHGAGGFCSGISFQVEAPAEADHSVNEPKGTSATSALADVHR